MKRAVVANIKGGTAMGMSKQDVRAAFRQAWGGDVHVAFAHGDDLPDVMRRTFENDRFSQVVVAGGDGTVSLAAKLSVETDKPFGVVPLGTMNLFARTLDLPLERDGAIRAMRDPVIEQVDCGEVNGEVFVNHVSLGFHPQLVRMRDAIPRGSRLKRMLNGTRVYLRLMRHHKRIQLTVDGDFEPFGAKAGLVVVSVNPIKEGTAQIPHPDGQQASEFGLYVSTHASAWDLNKVVWRLLNGTLTESEHVAFRRTKRVTVKTPTAVHMSVDGEVRVIETPIECRMLAGRLSVLVPRARSVETDADAAEVPERGDE